jgi:predicted aspartyl protease
MIKLQLKYGLPFVTLDLIHNGKVLHIEDVLIDTGSAGTILKMDVVEEIGITIDLQDNIETISGVGGKEFVYIKKVEGLKLGELEVTDFEAEIGVMDYGFDINGIVGMNFLKAVSAIIDLDNMEIRRS